MMCAPRQKLPSEKGMPGGQSCTTIGLLVLSLSFLLKAVFTKSEINPTSQNYRQPLGISGFFQAQCFFCAE